MKEVVLPSGAKLKITLSPFAVSRDLFQAVTDEMKSLNVSATTEIDVNLFKDLFCTGIASKRIEKSLWECMKRATYNELKISDETFEPAEARQDYIQVLFEVAKENLAPFMKSLYAVFAEAMQKAPQARP